MRRFAIVAMIAGCGDNIPAPIDVPSGRLTARITEQPAQIELFLDRDLAWSTLPGSGDAPYGFAAVAPITATITADFGSFEFIEPKAAVPWRTIDRLGDVAATGDGATFSLWSGDDRMGDGELVFDSAVTSGPDPADANYPGHVQIVLAANSGQRITLASSLADGEHLVGLGGQSYDVDHRGQTAPLWVQEDGIGKDPTPDDEYSGVWFLTGRRHSTHSPMPMLVSSRGYALAIDTTTRVVFALGSEVASAARFEAWEPKLDLQVFVGDGPRYTDVAGAAARDALGHMIAWVGKPARPPLSVFAPWVDAIFGSDHVREVAAHLRAAGVASSVIWTEDWRGGEDTATGYQLKENWRVDRSLYPDIEQLATDLHGLGFAFLVYNNTFLDSSGDVYAEATGDGYAIHDTTGATYTFNSAIFDPTTVVDLTNPAAVAWAMSVMTAAIGLGADGWMADFGEWQPTDAVLASGEDALAVHNRYPVDWARMNQQMLSAGDASRPAPLYFMRSAWIHSQPLVQVLWPGDQQTDWSDGDGFPSVIPMGIGLGVTGFPYFGSDIAGYMSQGTVPTSEELFYRWVTFGALSPVMRTHHGRSARDNFQWEHDDASVAHFRRWTRLHMQLAAYLSGSIGSFERDGLPLFRLTALEFPDEDWAWTALDQYMLGDRILVAPVQVQGATSRALVLPAGTWYPLLGGPAVTGGATMADAPMTEIPAYVPAGALLVVYPDGIDTVNAAPTAPTAVTAASVGGNRDVWLWPGLATDPARAQWHDDLGVAAPPQWTWAGRAIGTQAPITASWNGSPAAITPGAGFVTVTVTGDGTLVFAGGGTLVIARGDAAAMVNVRLYE